jgi:AcrR family transcriptional regulator
MASQSTSEKTSRRSRTYRSELRQQQAEQTRSRVIDAAAELFANHGYARTTLARIAEAAGVSPETVQGQGPKAALLISAAEYAAVGVAGEENLLNLEVGRRLIAIQDRDEALDHLAAFVAELHERTAKLGLALIGGASVDSELDRYLNDFIAGINRQTRRVLGVWRDRGWLREDVSFDELVETSAVICSVDTFLRITHRDRWTVSRYQAWVRRMLAETVFRPETVRR